MPSKKFTVFKCDAGAVHCIHKRNQDRITVCNLEKKAQDTYGHKCPYLNKWNVEEVDAWE